MNFMGKKTNILIAIFITVLFALPAFAGTDGKAKKMFEKGQYESAVNRLAEKLRKKDDHQDNIRYMEKCLKAAFKTSLREAEDYEMDGDLDASIATYTRIRRMADNVSLLTVRKETKVNGKKRKQEHVFEIVDVSDLLRELKIAATKDHYESGLFYQEQSDWRNAAISYRKASNYRKNYKDVSSRYELCREKGMIKIAVMPFENKSGRQEFGAMGDFIASEIISSAIDADPEFIRFISREYLDQLLAEQGLQKTDVIDKNSAVEIGKFLGVHAFVFGKIFSIIPDSPQDLRSHYKKTGTIKVYNKKTKKSVRVPAICDYTVIERMRSVRVQASYQVIAVETGEIVSSESLSEDKSDGCTWIVINRGNEKVIPRTHKKLITPGGQKRLAATELMASDAATSMAKTLAHKLVQKYE